MDKLKTCRFPYDTKLITIIFELLKNYVPYDILRYIWNYYVNLPPGIFSNILQLTWCNYNHTTYKKIICNNIVSYKNNLVYINLLGIKTIFNSRNHDTIHIQINNITDKDFSNYLQKLDDYIFNTIINDHMINYKYDKCVGNTIYNFEVKKKKIQFQDTPYRDYFNFVKNLGIYFRPCIFRNDNMKKYGVNFVIKHIEYIDLQ